MLEVIRLSKRFNGLSVLNGVTLSVERGETVGLIGPNGAGKTTLFNVISGFLRPDEGQIRFHGDGLVGLAPHQISHRGIGRTFQLVQPFSGMTVLDNVAAGCLFGRHRSASIPEARDRARHLLGLVTLDAKADQPAGDLTLSERKRLEIVRALATEPELLLLDEVMAGLNPAESQEMDSLIRQMKSEFHLTLLIIEHNVRLITGLSHRIAVLNYGSLIVQGDPAEVVRHPEVITAYLGERKRGNV